MIEEDLEYAVQHVCLNCSELGECDKGVHCEFLKIVRECYDDAIEEGRKEVREHETTCVNRLHHIEKENKELKAQIEKMKCCENCKHYIDSSCELETPIRCKYWYSMIVNATDEWELAE